MLPAACSSSSLKRNSSFSCIAQTRYPPQHDRRRRGSGPFRLADIFFGGEALCAPNTKTDSVSKAYPSPAFVLIVPCQPRARPRLVSRDTDVTIRNNDSPYAGPSKSPIPSTTFAWGNDKWHRATEERPIQDCFEHSILNRLQAWTQSDDPTGQDTPPVRDDSLFSLYMSTLGVKLSLAKTIVPLSPPSSTHAFCIITTQARSARAAALSTESSASPSLRSSTVDNRWYGNASDGRTSVSTDFGSTHSPNTVGFNSYFPPVTSSHRSSSSRSRVGRLSPFSERSHPNEQLRSAADECWQCMDRVDWSKTCLGPRSLWADSIEPLLAVVFQSASQDSLWLGEDMLLIG